MVEGKTVLGPPGEPADLDWAIPSKCPLDGGL